MLSTAEVGPGIPVTRGANINNKKKTKQTNRKIKMVCKGYISAIKSHHLRADSFIFFISQFNTPLSTMRSFAAMRTALRPSFKRSQRLGAVSTVRSLSDGPTFEYADLFELSGATPTPYYKVTDEHVSTVSVRYHRDNL